MQALSKESQNTAFSSAIQQQIITLNKGVTDAFNGDQSVSDRLSYTLQTVYNIYRTNNTISQIIEKIPLGSWGTVYDVFFYSLTVSFFYYICSLF